MTVGEHRMQEIICYSLPRIAKELERANKLKALEIDLKIAKMADANPNYDGLDSRLKAIMEDNR